MGRNRSTGTGRDQNNGSSYKGDNFDRNKGFQGKNGGRSTRDRYAAGNTVGSTDTRWEWNEPDMQHANDNINAFHDEAVYIFGAVRFQEDPWPRVEALSDVPESYRRFENELGDGASRHDDERKRDCLDQPSDNVEPRLDGQTAENDSAKEGLDKRHCAETRETAAEQSDKMAADANGSNESKADSAAQHTDVSEEVKPSNESESSLLNVEEKVLGEKF